jgi:low affinity Fe/Cu permease
MIRRAFDQFALRVSEAAGTSVASVVALLVLAIWAVSGPLFGFSDTWQLLINTGTTVVTFLMVFLIQHSENKNSRAVHLKLDELIAASHRASNELIDLERSTDEDMDEVHERLSKLAEGGFSSN